MSCFAPPSCVRNNGECRGIQQRIAADPEGGLPHRIYTHGMLAALWPIRCMVAIMSGQPDIFHGFLRSV